VWHRYGNRSKADDGVWKNSPPIGGRQRTTARHQTKQAPTGNRCLVAQNEAARKGNDQIPENKREEGLKKKEGKEVKSVTMRAKLRAANLGK